MVARTGSNRVFQLALFAGHKSKNLSQHLSFRVPTENFFPKEEKKLYLFNVVAFGMAQINLSTIWHSFKFISLKEKKVLCLVCGLRSARRRCRDISVALSFKFISRWVNYEWHDQCLAVLFLNTKDPLDNLFKLIHLLPFKLDVSRCFEDHHHHRSSHLIESSSINRRNKMLLERWVEFLRTFH